MKRISNEIGTRLQLGEGATEEIRQVSLSVIGTGLSRANNTRARVADMQASIVDIQLMMMAPEETKKVHC